MKNIYKKGNAQYCVSKKINKTVLYFGCYPSLESARRMRNELIAVNWNMEEYQEIRDKLRAEGVEL